VDFTVYKPTTLKRRILRRMALAQMESFARYLSYLSDHTVEAEVLYQDLLIGVTSFFREPASCALLAREVFPRLVETKSAQAPIRVWVPGCSTGEEVYSLAICLLEFLAEREQRLPIQLYGTDLNTQAIERARAGLYFLEQRMEKMDLPALPFGAPSVYSCPDCGGVLQERQEGSLLRFRCQVGHAFSVESLLAVQPDILEQALWSALKTLWEWEHLLQRLSDQAQQAGLPALTSHSTDRLRETRQHISHLEQVLRRET
jgi:hypothetical protein